MYVPAAEAQMDCQPRFVDCSAFKTTDPDRVLGTCTKERRIPWNGLRTLQEPLAQARSKTSENGLEVGCHQVLPVSYSLLTPPAPPDPCVGIAKTGPEFGVEDGGGHRPEE